MYHNTIIIINMDEVGNGTKPKKSSSETGTQCFLFPIFLIEMLFYCK